MKSFMEQVAASSIVCSKVRFRPRRGTSAFEVLVAFSLLTTVLGVSMPLIVRHGRLLVSHRHYRLAMDELSNQADRLTTLPTTELPDALQQLAPSASAESWLPGAVLSGQLEGIDIGQRLTLQLSWDEFEPQGASISMSTWIFPDSQRPVAPSRGRESP